MIKLKLLVVITQSGCQKILKHIYKKNGISFDFMISGSGTAPSNVLEYLGLSDVRREISIAIIPGDLEYDLLDAVNNSLNLENLGRGLAFCVALTSANKFLINNYDKEYKKEIKIMKDVGYHLILTIVLEGHLQEVMDAAKRKGARGGTVIRGRGIGNNDAIKMFGFEIEPGREIVLNVVESEIKNQVMEEITKCVGIKTSGKGICISLPVDSAIGVVNNNDAKN